MQKDRNDLMDAVQKDWFKRNAPADERKKMIKLNENGADGIASFKFDPTTGNISSVELSTGESLVRTKQPTALVYLVLPLYSLIGFLIPWGILTTLSWVGSGFFSKASIRAAGSE